MATFEDAAAGWEIFRSRAGVVSRTQVNAALSARGRDPISDRTFGHYQKLHRLGYTEYVSINRLDIRHANDSVFDLADRSRYLDRAISNPGRVLIPRGTLLLTLEGTIGRVSEGFATLRVARTDEASNAAKSTKYDKAVLVFDQVGVERAVQIVEGVERGDFIDLLLEFRSLLETDILFGTSPFEQSASLLRVDLGTDASLYRLLGAVHTTFDLFESVRAIIDVSAASAVETPPSTPVLRVRHMEFSNPLELLVLGAVGVVVGVAHLVQRVADATAKVQEINHATKAERRLAELHPLEKQSMQLDNLKKAIELAPLLEALNPSISQVLGVEIPRPGSHTLTRLEALKDQAVEAAVELQASSNEPIALTAGDPSDTTAEDTDSGHHE
jgi:hypothetical protein